MATLTITISDEALAGLVKRAESKGLTPEIVAAADLETCETSPGEPIDDDFLKWAGAFDSGLADVAERHDYYLGQALADEGKKGKVVDPVR